MSHLVAVHVKAVGAVDALKDYGLPAHGLECAHGRVNTARKQGLRLRKDLQRKKKVPETLPV